MTPPKSSRLHYARFPLSANTVEKYLSDKKAPLKSIVATKTHPKDSSSFLIEAQLPYVWKPAWLRFEQATIATTAGGKDSRHIFSLFLNRCEKKKSCKVAKARASEDALKLSNWEFLPIKTTVTEVYYGDVNHDNKSDILLKLSTGAGILFQSITFPPKAKVKSDF